MVTTEQSFKAEIKQLLNILIHSLYQDRDIFLRELISNASDALTRLRFEQLTNSTIVSPDAELAIWLELQGEGDAPKKLIIKDSGIGMSADELTRHLGTIAQSGARDFMAKLEDGKTPPSEIIGQFGVGFYSVFMVADEVRVISRSHRPEDEAAMWVSDGGELFRVESADKQDRGTEIHITLRSDASEMAHSWKLREIIKKHSDYVNYPIYLDGNKVNSQESLWRKPSSEVSDTDRQQFYQQMTLDFVEPLATVHFSSDTPVPLRALLFIPAKRERGMFSLRKEPGVKLYTNNVLIKEYCTDLLPAWLNFVDGVVDSEELPLNVSRETVQNNRLMQQLAKVVKKRVLRAIKELADGDKEKFATFWQEFGRIFKEGLAVDPSAKEEIEPLLHFVSSQSDGALTSLQSYVERMSAEQEAIHYVIGDSLSTVTRSPHLDPFKQKGWEVLYFVEPIDSFLVTAWQEFQGKPLKNVDEVEIELPEEPQQLEDSAEQEEELSAFLTHAQQTLGERVSEVKLSKVLRDSPVRLVAPKNDSAKRNMDRIQRLLNQEYEVPQQLLEVNKQHPIIRNLAHKLASNPQSAELVDLAIEQLYESALLQEGLHPSPSSMLPRIQRLLELLTV